MTASLARWATGPIPLSTNSINNLTLDASGEKLASILSLPVGDTITHAWTRYGLRTGTPPTYRISIQALDASGNPDGTILGGGSPASATFTPPADATWNGTGRWIALSNSIALNGGTLYSVVIDYSSGTIDASNNSSFGQYHDGVSPRKGVPYDTFHNGTSWSKQAGSVVALKSATAVYGWPMLINSSDSASANGHRAAAKLTVPTAWCSTYKVAGLRFKGAGPASADWKIGVWDTAGTMIQDATYDADAQASPGNTQREHEMYFDEVSLTALSAGTAYYFGVERTTQTVALDHWTLEEANDRTAFAFGTGVETSTWNGSAWSDSTTKLPIIELILADVTAPAGGSGGGLLIGPGRLIV